MGKKFFIYPYRRDFPACPDRTISGVQVYQGKIFYITAISPGPHKLTLTGGATFFDGSKTIKINGIGSSITLEPIEVNGMPKVAILSQIGV